MNQQSIIIMKNETNDNVTHDNNNKNHNHDLFIRLLSGTIGSIITSLVVTPLEVAKVRIQQSPTSSTSTTSTLSSSTPSSSSTTTTTTTTTTTSTNQLQPQKQQNVLRNTTPLVEKSPSSCCNTFRLYNGHMDCIISKNWVSYFDHNTGECILPHNIHHQQHHQSIRQNKGIPFPRFNKVMNYIKTLSLSSSSAAAASIVSSNNISTNSNSNNSTFGMIRRIFLYEGWYGLYAGLRPTLVMSIPNTVMYFTSYDELVIYLRQQYHSKYHINNKQQNQNEQHHDDYIITSIIPLLSGMTARFITTIVISPLELIRTRQAAHSTTISADRIRTPSMYEEFRSIIQEQQQNNHSNTNTKSNQSSLRNISHLFRGLRPTLYRDVPFSGIYWVCIEQFRSWNKHRIDNNDSSYSSSRSKETTTNIIMESFVFGAISGMIAAACTAPMDIIKTRQQSNDVLMFYEEQHKQNQQKQISNNNNSIWNHMKSIINNEHGGIRALWKGNVARMLKIAPSCAIMLSSYEYGKYYFHKSQYD